MDWESEVRWLKRVKANRFFSEPDLALGSDLNVISLFVWYPQSGLSHVMLSCLFITYKCTDHFHSCPACRKSIPKGDLG